MKRIIYILDDDRRSFAYERVKGFCRAVKNTETPANLYIFRSNGFAGYDKAHNCGEYNIYRLPDFNDFDGIILDINNSHNTAENIYGDIGASYVMRAAAASGKPVISIGNNIEGFYYIGIDNYSAMTSVITYLHEELGLNDFWFLMGPVDNYENRIRTKALREYCEEHGIPCETSRFYFESFDMESGINGFKRLYSLYNGKLPQVLICANDPIASGAVRTAGDMGIRIPKDLFVTGFDNQDISKYITPSVTTVEQNRHAMGEEGIKILEALWKGEKVENVRFVRTEIIKRESTGGPVLSEKNIIDRLADAVNKEVYTERINNHICAIQYKLPGCQTLDEICKTLEAYLPDMKCRAVWIAIDSELNEYGNYIEIDEESSQVRSSEINLKTEGYPESLELIFSWDKYKGASYPHEMIQGLFPCFEGSEKGLNYMFIPIHFMEKTVGFMAICDCMEMLLSRSIAPLVNTISMAMRSFFYGKKLEYLNDILSGVSMSDKLTDLYNRLGYHNFAVNMFRRSHETGERLGVLFMDMDKLKYINDTFGHACGDDAIRSIATSVKNSIPAEAVPVRYGGDEILVITPIDKDEDMEEIVNRIHEDIPKTARGFNLPVLPDVSAGYVITDPGSPLTLEEYVEEADKLMYNEKLLKRVERG